MFLAPIDGKLFAFYCLETFANNILSIGIRGMKILPFDAHRHGDSNEPYFVILRFLNAEINRTVQILLAGGCIVTLRIKIKIVSQKSANCQSYTFLHK